MVTRQLNDRFPIIALNKSSKRSLFIFLISNEQLNRLMYLLKLGLVLLQRQSPETKKRFVQQKS